MTVGCSYTLTAPFLINALDIYFVKATVPRQNLEVLGTEVAKFREHLLVHGPRAGDNLTQHKFWKQLQARAVLPFCTARTRRTVLRSST